MVDHLNAVLARIGEIQGRFGVNPASSGSGAVSGADGSAPQFFPKVLADMMQSNEPDIPQGPVKFDELISSAAERNDLPPGLLKAVVRAESSFKPNVVSRAGAVGLMQLMPSTAKSLGVDDPFDPAQNIEGGAKYLKQQIDRFGDIPRALAAYNAGPGAVARYGGIPPYNETQNYVRKVLEYSRSYGMDID